MHRLLRLRIRSGAGQSNVSTGLLLRVAHKFTAVVLPGTACAGKAIDPVILNPVMYWRLDPRPGYFERHAANLRARHFAPRSCQAYRPASRRRLLRRESKPIIAKRSHRRHSGEDLPSPPRQCYGRRSVRLEQGLCLCGIGFATLSAFNALWFNERHWITPVLR